MSDFYRYLPLNGREHGDESGVSSDWRPRIAQTIAHTTEALRALPAEVWTEPTLRPAPGIDRSGPQSVQTVLQNLCHRLSSSRVDLLVGRPAPSLEPAQIMPLLDQLAARAAGGGGRGSLGELDAVVTACYDVCFALSLPDPTDSTGSGAVALGRAATVPAVLKGVIRGRTITATDAGWEIGRGPAIRGSAMLLVLWLAGRPLRPSFD